MTKVKVDTMSKAERRVVRAAMKINSHPNFDVKTGWVLGNTNRSILMSNELWNACAKLQRERGKP